MLQGIKRAPKIIHRWIQIQTGAKNRASPRVKRRKVYELPLLKESRDYGSKKGPTETAYANYIQTPRTAPNALFSCPQCYSSKAITSVKGLPENEIKSC